MNVLTTVAGGKYTLLATEGNLPVEAIDSGELAGVSGGYFALAEDTSTSSLSFQDIVSADFNASGNNSQQFSASFCVRSDTAASRAKFRLTLDGIELSGVGASLQYAAAGSLCGHMQVALSALAAGPHTLALQWAVDDESGATLSINLGASEHASLMFLSFGG